MLMFGSYKPTVTCDLWSVNAKLTSQLFLLIPKKRNEIPLYFSTFLHLIWTKPKKKILNPIFVSFTYRFTANVAIFHVGFKNLHTHTQKMFNTKTSYNTFLDRSNEFTFTFYEEQKKLQHYQFICELKFPFGNSF